ncbi:MAG: MBL fold metallo-hydrolase, partial [Lentisphaerae bacterium]|nr:MBL fold metallo-hydrolase [Lentisphaerota bacterium]
MARDVQGSLHRVMGITLCVLGSGSTGNCMYVGSPATHILVDAGLSGKETVRRLEEIGADPSDLSAICVTHEHDDHTACLGILHRRLGLDLYGNAGTVDALKRNPKHRDLPWNVFQTGAPFAVGDLIVEPFSVPHDAYDPVGFVVRSGSESVGIVTDMGMATGLVRERLRGCRALVLESNHDSGLLRDADRPWSLKQRIAGRQGHLSNEQTGILLAEIAGPQLDTVCLAHLSEECNRP